MRLYLPATLLDLAREAGLAPTAAHCVTPDLAAALPDEDDEGLEYAAMLAAADASVSLLAQTPAAPRRRVVVVANVREAVLEPAADGLPSEVVPPTGVAWTDVVSLHVDDAAAEPDVSAAASGDDDAGERAADRDLLWYDVSELDAVRRIVG